MPSALDAAQGRWPDILATLGGLSSDQLTNRHQPCPSCGGSDRYRWDDDAGDGAWFCNQCGGKQRQGGGGNGLDLLMRVRNWSFTEATQQLERHLGIDPAPSTPTKRSRKPHRTPETPPPDAPPPPLNRGAVAQWCYTSASGDQLFYIQRINLPDGGKAFIHRVWLDGSWHRPSKDDPFTCDWPAPRPLLNLHAITAKPFAHILLTEGEKPPMLQPGSSPKQWPPPGPMAPKPSTKLTSHPSPAAPASSGPITMPRGMPPWIASPSGSSPSAAKFKLQHPPRVLQKNGT